MADVSSALSVTQLNEYVKSLVDADVRLRDVYIKGEISNFKNHYSTGHYYFSLKDDTSALRAVMFKSSAAKMTFVPENGMLVVAHGRISAFVRDGQYQLYADSLEPDGVGSLYIAYEQLKRKLEAEGLFSAEHKRPLPKIPSRVGVITSATGAAVRDIINVTGRRFPFAEVTVYPALVQGEGAVASLIAGLDYFAKTGSADVIIIGRGGGSIEDLWAFNSELLARKIAASPIPVISAVGHETDFTIADFVADMRAPTPSAAAEIAVPDTAELKHKISNIIRRESALLSQRIAAARDTLKRYSETRTLSDPTYQIDERRMTLAYFSEKLNMSAQKKASDGRAALALAAGKLSALDPLAVLTRGYGAVYDTDGKIVKSVSQLAAGEKVNLRLCDGVVGAEVREITKNETR